MRTTIAVLAACLFAVGSLPAWAGIPTDQDYARDGLSVIYRTEQVAYAVDTQKAELNEQGIRLWLQTDFTNPQGITRSGGNQARNLAHATIDCVGHRMNFSQIRYYSASGELVGSIDKKTAWQVPREGSVGQTLIREICTRFVPTLEDARVAATAPSRVPADALAQTHSLRDQVPSQP